MPSGNGLIPARSTVWNSPSKLERRLGPQATHQLDLLGLTAAAVRERLVEGDVLDFVPSGPDAEAQAVARQHGDLGGLLGDEHGLALGQDHDALTSSNVVVTPATNAKNVSGSWNATSLS